MSISKNIKNNLHTVINTWRLNSHIKHELTYYNQLLLIHQMGKVGSSSVYNTLKTIVDIPIYHTHFLSKEGITYATNFFLKSGNAVPNNIILSKILRKYLHKGIRIYIITLTRDPIAREISDYFQLGSRIYKVLSNNNLESYHEMILSEILTKINKLKSHNHHIYNWFDNEIKNTFQVDVYNNKFDLNRGYNIISKNNISICIIRLENLSNIFSRAISDLFDKDYHHIYLNTSNITEKKRYSDAYKYVTNNINLPYNDLNVIYNSKYALHFYEDLIPSFIERWSQ